MALCAGCQSGASQPTDDHRRVEQLITAVEALRAAYERRDLPALQALRSPSANLEQLKRDATQDFFTYDAIALTMKVERMYLRGEQATVNVRWEGTWRHGADEPAVTDRGYGVLVWSGRETALLEDMTGNLPFGMAGR